MAYSFEMKNRSLQRQPPRGVLSKRCSENMQQIYRRTPMPKCSPVNLLHIFRTPFIKNASGRLLLSLSDGEPVLQKY